jgi:hypothetical protein
MWGWHNVDFGEVMSMFHIFEGETVDFGGTREVISLEILNREYSNKQVLAVIVQLEVSGLSREVERQQGREIP